MLRNKQINKYSYYYFVSFLCLRKKLKLKCRKKGIVCYIEPSIFTIFALFLGANLNLANFVILTMLRFCTQGQISLEAFQWGEFRGQDGFDSKSSGFTQTS